MNDIPIPEPRYKRAASIVVGISSSSSLEKGELIAYNAAAKTAYIIDLLFFDFTLTALFHIGLYY
jgi:hypothetical protein